jgi:tRNA dimethylallyltransferase
LNERGKLVVILGPTGVGKTALAVQLAQHFHTQILSADSRQFFKELNIGVARPSEEELRAAVHHFIAFLSITEEFSAGRFEVQAISLLEELFSKNKVVICAGGSMMYVDALIHGLDDLPSDNQLKKELESIDLAELLIELEQRDPSYFQYVDRSNPHRIIRAIEVCRLTGKKFSELRTSKKSDRNFDVIKLGLTGDRDWIYHRINLRVDKMMEVGLEEEARSLYSMRHLNALNTVGYKELFEFFDGKMNREEAINKIKQYSRNFAKRQLTWWRRDESIHWIDAQNQTDVVGSAIRMIG